MASQMQCAVCLCIFNSEGPPVCSTSCGHLFHRECADRCKVDGSLKCPSCRRENVTSHPIFGSYTEGELVIDRGEIEALRSEISYLREREATAVADKERVQARNEQLQEQYDFHVMTLTREEEETRHENTRLYNEVERLRAQTPRELERMKSRMETARARHEAQVAELTRDMAALQARNDVLRVENEAHREAQVRHQNLELEIHDVRRQNQGLARELKVAKRCLLENQQRKHHTTYADNKLTIRNLPPRVAADPKAEITRVLDWLSIASSPEGFEVIECAPMLSCPDLLQATLECASYALKIEIITGSARLQDSGRAAFRRLEVRDSVTVSDFYKVVKGKLLGKKGIRSARLIHDQIMVHISGEQTPREINSETQLAELLEALAPLVNTPAQPE